MIDDLMRLTETDGPFAPPFTCWWQNITLALLQAHFSWWLTGGGRHQACGIACCRHGLHKSWGFIGPS